MGPIERMTGLNDVTKPAIKFKAIDQELLQVRSYKRRIIVGCAMALGLAVLAWWHFIPEQIVTQPLACLSPRYVDLVNQTFVVSKRYVSCTTQALSVCVMIKSFTPKWQISFKRKINLTH